MGLALGGERSHSPFVFACFGGLENPTALAFGIKEIEVDIP